MALAAELTGVLVAGAAGPGPERAAALGHEAGDHAVELQPVVEAELRQVDRARDVHRRVGREEAHADRALGGLQVPEVRGVAGELGLRRLRQAGAPARLPGVDARVLGELLELGEDLLGRYRNSFLIRDPRWAVASFAHKWPDVTADEVGFDALGEAYDIACDLHEAAGEPPPVVIDTADLRADPPAVVEAWCEAVDLEFDGDALTWSPGMQPQWELWPDWYRGTAASTGFAPPADEPPPDLPPRLEAVEAECRPVYERLHQQRLRP